MVTPFKDGKVDYEAYTALVRRQADAGIDFIVPLATTGETPTLTPEEKIELLRITRSNFSGPLLVGCGSNSVAATLSNMQLLEPYGVDGWLVVVPFYNKPTQQGMYLYFKEIASHTNKPVVIYNVPGRTGANMTPETCLRLANEVPNIVGTKEASGDIEQILRIIPGKPEGFSVLSGDDDLTAEVILKGGDGVVSVASNVAPKEVIELAHTALERNKDKEVEKLQERLHPLFKNCFAESNPIPVKAALEIMGLASAEVRLPLSEAEQQTKDLMAKTIKELWK